MLRLRFEGLAEFRERLEYIAKQAHSTIGKALDESAKLVEAESKRTIYSSPPRTLGQETGGRLRSSLYHQLDTTRLRAYVGSALIYAPVHEYGKTIRAKNKPYLMFFLTEEQLGGFTRVKYSVNKYTGERRAVKAMTRGQYFKGKRGHWVQVKEVTIPARPYLGPALYHEREAIRNELGKAIQGLMDGEKG